MYRVSINKTTGKVIEMQSGGKVERLAREKCKTEKEYTAHLAACEALEAGRLATLKQNAVNAGYAEQDVEVKWVTDEEYAALTAPTAEEIAAQMKQRAIDGIQTILDAQAKAYGFDTIHTAAVWTISKNEARKARADALVAWADSVWDFAEAEWEKQAEGKGTFKTVAEFLAGAPKFPGVTG